MSANRWAPKIDEITAAFSAAFGHLSPEQLQQQPSPGGWSIAQNIEHLIVINESYFPIIRELQAGTYRTHWLGKLNFMVKWLGNFILQSVQAYRKQKIKTLPMWEPKGETKGTDILGRFAQHQETLKDMIAQCETLIQKGTVISSPANRHIVYTLEQAFDILVTHEERHLEQAKEVLGRNL